MTTTITSPTLQITQPNTILNIIPISHTLYHSPYYFYKPKTSYHTQTSLLPYKIPKPHSNPQKPKTPKQHQTHNTNLNLNLQTQNPQTNKPKNFSFNSFNPLHNLQNSKLTSKTFSYTHFYTPPPKHYFSTHPTFISKQKPKKHLNKTKNNLFTNKPNFHKLFLIS